MRGRRVDAAKRMVWVEGGCTWGDVDHATHAFGLATPSGIISTTGVGGLTLGGGLGHLTRKCGLTIDDLLAADLVQADGRFVTASPEENPDLFVLYPPGLQWYRRADFVNQLSMDEGQERVKATYRDNYDRLVAVKKKYDPTNFFRVNQNIKPSV